MALVLAQLRQQRGPLSWIAVGLASTQLLLNLRKQYKDLTSPDIWSYFSDEEVWSIAPPLLANLLIKSCDSQEVVGKADEHEIILGCLGEERIAWRAQSNRLDYGPFFRRGHEAATLRALGVKLWGQINGPHAVLGDKGTIESADESIDHPMVEFDALTSFHDRVQKFYAAGVNRSYLLEGPPGTGKSTAVRYLLSKTKLRSLRLNFDTASQGTMWHDGDGISRNVEALIQTLRPEMLIIDDFDRNWMNERELLRLMELAHRVCRVVIATINNRSDLSGAMQRVGRFDDHIVVDRIELKVLKAMLDPELQKYARQMVKWPIAFVGDLNSRKRILGVMAASEEFKDLHTRATGKRPKSAAKKAAKTKGTSKSPSNATPRKTKKPPSTPRTIKKPS